MNAKLPREEDKNKLASIQAFLPFEEIREDVIVLKNGGLRAVLLVRGTNFGLRSAQEQSAIIYAYQTFLNSLEFPLQILVRSKKINLDPYLKSLENMLDKQQNELLRLQTLEYIDSLKILIEQFNVMKKEFYVVVAYNPMPIKSGFWSNLLAPLLKQRQVKQKEQAFQTNKEVLNERAGMVENALARIGLKAVRLKTSDLIELLYESYNPDLAYEEKIYQLDTLAINTDYIRKQ